jgi:hypothetical protein
MASPIEIQLILADAAQVANGKVSMLGAGWSITTSPTPPSAVVGLLKVPWDRANQRLPLHLVLVDTDGHPVRQMNPATGAEQPLEFQATIEVGRPPGLQPGTPLDSPFAVPVPPLPLQAGRYTWRLEVGGDLADASFTVSPPSVVG